MLDDHYPTCNLPADLIKKWVKMSKAASLEQSGSKDISQRLLNLDLGGQPPMLVGEYMIWIKKQLEWLEFPRSWTMRSQVNVIVIPVRISGNWCLYQIMRGPTPR